jgi:D-alanine-D-alanine ligase
MKRRRITVLCHEDLVPPLSDEGYDDQEYQHWKTEYDVADTLRWLGHDVNVLGVSDDLRPIRRNLDEVRPHVMFNLLMEFRDIGSYQAHIVAYLELIGARFTGCNSRGILLTRDKALCKKILRYHRIATPHFTVFPKDKPVRLHRSLEFPLIVKSVDEEASLGISQASVVTDEERLRERVSFVHRHVGTDAIAEEYIEGRELTLGILGNERLTTFPVWELFFERLPDGALPIATARVKFDLAYQEKRGITIGRARDLPSGLESQISRMGKRVYRILGLSGYARLDLRLAPDGRVFVIEVNSTPDVAENEDFAVAAEAGGIEYPTLVQRIVNLGLTYRSPSTG